jgi:SpoIIAA-like
LLIEAPAFPGWDSFAALVEHIKFVKDHHRKVDRIAVLTDSKMLRIVPKLAAKFAYPEFKVFGSGERVNALAWLETGV